MHGHIHLCLKELVLEKFGEDVWKKILQVADSDDTDDFMLYHQYPEELTERLIKAATDISGIERNTLLEVYGEYFYHYTERRGYASMLRTLGDDYVSFLKRLDFLHTLLATTYEGMVPPHFRCEERNGKVYLHMYSKRGRGLCHIAVGLAREVGIRLFNVQVQSRLLSVETLDGDPRGYQEYSVIEILTDSTTTPESDLQLETSKPDIPGRECPFSRSSVSELVMPTRSLRAAIPYHLVLNKTLELCSCGNALQKLLCEVKYVDGEASKYFTLIEPDIEFSYSAILENLNKDFILIFNHEIKTSDSHQVNLKGHFVEMSNSNYIIFIGSPYFSSLRELMTNKATLTTFPKDDIVRELFFIGEKAKAEVQISKRLDTTTAELQKLSKDLEKEKQRTDELLYQILPSKVADQLRDGRRVEAEKFKEASVLFSDIVTFTTMSAECEPMDIVGVLNDLFQRFDALTSTHDVYKVETIGDAYMIVSGVPDVLPDHAHRVARMGLDMIASARQVGHPNTGQPIQIRVGIHTGPVVAGVVGRKMPRYCLFGDTVNTASRMESHGVPGRVHVSESTYQQLMSSEFIFRPRGLTRIKGKGKMNTYFLTEYREKTELNCEDISRTAENISVSKVSRTDTKTFSSSVCLIL